jgi:hypothetical protein
MIKSRIMRWSGQVARKGFCGKEGKRPLGRPRHRWNDNMTLKEIEWSGMDWFHLAQNREQVAVSCEHSNKLLNSIKCWETLEWLNDWRLLKKGSAPWI